MQFRNPVNGYVETATAPGFFCLLFGPLYFLSKGVVFHAIISFAVAFMTFGVSWLIYPIFAGNAVRKAYLRKGWTEVNSDNVVKMWGDRPHQDGVWTDTLDRHTRRTSHAR